MQSSGEQFYVYTDTFVTAFPNPLDVIRNIVSKPASISVAVSELVFLAQDDSNVAESSSGIVSC